MSLPSPWRSAASFHLRSGVELAPAGGGRWQARWDFDEVTFLEGEACERALPWLAPLLAAPRTLEELREAARGRCAGDDIDRVLRALVEKGFVVAASERGPAEPGGPGRPQEPGGHEEPGGPEEPDPIRERLDRTSLLVLGRSKLAELVARAAAEQGFSRVRQEASRLEAPVSSGEGPVASGEGTGYPGEGSVFPVVVEPDWPSSDLERFNLESVAARRPWMLLGAWPSRVLVGPIFLPGETACYACYRKRLASHRRHLEAYEALEAWRLLHPPPLPAADPPPAVAGLAASWAALELFRHAGGREAPRTLGRVLACDPGAPRVTVERVLRIPWCPACDGARRA
ncbi:MAG: TOMM precursor leader peptide-binding protein [Planctomycetes bacterium]|nr:TOMM precursor leader peptide-binding protein [Planctomycetota bacterium]